MNSIWIDCEGGKLKIVIAEENNIVKQEVKNRNNIQILSLGMLNYSSD
jgi:hypothetical protein